MHSRCNASCESACFCNYGSERPIYTLKGDIFYVYGPMGCVFQKKKCSTSRLYFASSFYVTGGAQQNYATPQLSIFTHNVRSKGEVINIREERAT